MIPPDDSRPTDENERRKVLRRTKTLGTDPARTLDDVNQLASQLRETETKLQQAEKSLLQSTIENRAREAALQDTQLFLRSALDALSSHIAILDEQGTIIEVNAAWHRFADENNFLENQHGIGSNYLDICGGAMGKYAEKAPAVTTGIREVMDGKLDEFQLEYPCHSPWEQSWFIVRATRFGGDGPVRVVIARENITERKLAEKATHRVLQRLNDAQRIAHIGDWEWDIATQKILWSPQVFEIVGRDPRLGPPPDYQTHIGIYDTANKAILEENVARASETGQAQEYELAILRPDGKTVHVQAMAVARKDHNGRVLSLYGTIQDITARKRAEAALQESEYRYRSLFDNMLEGYAYCATEFEGDELRDFTYLQVNDAFARLTALEHVVGKKISVLIPGIRETNPEIFDVYSRVALTGKSEKLETYVEGLDIWFSITVYSSEREHFVAIFDNITGRKRAEAELRRKTALLEAQLNSSIDGILIVDEKGKKILQNQRFSELLSIPPHIAQSDEGVMRRWFTDSSKHPEQFLERVAYLYSHQNEIGHDEIEMKDGKILDRYSAPVVGLDGHYFGRIWTFRDITKRKRMETQLIQSQKLETVGKLAGGIAHEFNSILTAIIGQSELLLGELPTDSSQARSAIEISRAAGRAATLTRQLLAYGRKQFLQPETLDLNRVIAGMAGIFQHLLGGEVDTQVIPARGLHAVLADASQIEQVIVNLLINAREAMPKGGKLTVETANVTFDEATVRHFSEEGMKAGEYVLLAITDTGVGMNAEIKRRVFDPFFSTKGVGEGTGLGLGLATCYGIVKQSGGHISVYSEPGMGTTFKIYLPQVEAKPQTPPQRLAAPGLAQGTETILLVEDEPALREVVTTLLRRLGYTVLVASDGIEALRLKHEPGSGKIDLLFTDLNMPHMSGKELAKRVQEIDPHTRVLFTSAYTENAIVHQGALDQGVALLQKPFAPSALAKKLREVLDQPATTKL